jgi:polyhydroxybutyrate depolymerase
VSAQPPPGTASAGRASPIIYRPASLSPTTPAPLLIVFHGAEGTPKLMVSLTNFDKVADEHGFVVAYLGSSGPTNKPWLQPSDTAYVGSMIDALEAGQVPGAGPIDPQRVYATGFSSGGYESYRVGCQLSTKLAAVAPVAVTMNGALYDSCRIKRPISIMITAGTGDGARFHGYPGRLPSVYQTAARWRAMDSCPAGEPAQTSHVGTADIQLWTGCANGTAVKLVAILGGTHLWPGMGGLAANNPDNGYDASEAIWAFVSQYTAAPLHTASIQLLHASLQVIKRQVQVFCRFALGQPVTLRVKLTAHGRTYFSGRRSGLRNRTVRLVFKLGSRVHAGHYVLRVLATDTYGRTRRLALPVTVPALT